MADYDGKWDCESCGTKLLSGLKDTKCPNCGAGQPEDPELFYLPEDIPALTDAKLIAEANSGADVVCASCDQGNPAGTINCINCGAPMAEGTARKTEEYLEANVPRGSGRDPRVVRPVVAGGGFSSPMNLPIHSNDYADSPRSKWPLIAGISGAVALVALILFLVFHTRDVVLKVTSHTWRSQVSVQQYRTVAEEDWKIPARGRQTGSHRAVHHHVSCDHIDTKTRRKSKEVKSGTRRYVCGKKNNGNGSFSDKYCTEDTYRTEHYTETYREARHSGGDPVYATKYEYNIDKWVAGNERVTVGTGTEPQWPAMNLAGNGSDTIGNEREAGRTRTFAAHFISLEKEEPKTYTMDLDEAKWRSFEDGGLYVATVDSFNNIREIKPKPSN